MACIGLSVSTTGIYGYLWIFSLKWSTDINNSLKDHVRTYKMFVSFYNESLSQYDFNQITEMLKLVKFKKLHSYS